MDVGKLKKWLIPLAVNDLLVAPKIYRDCSMTSMH
jgi:hypothetical protein